MKLFKTKNKKNISTLIESFIRLRKLFLLPAAVLLVLSGLIQSLSLAQASPPAILGYQGRLYDSSSNLETGTFCLKFSIYDASSGGTKLWPAGAPSAQETTVTNGVFNAGIGDTSAGGDALDFAFLDSNDYFLNVEIAEQVGGACTGGDETFETISTRQPLYASAFAQSAQYLHSSAAEDTERARFTDTSNADSVSIYVGDGSPNGALSAERGSIFLDQSGGFYVNTSGAGSGTTWVDIASGGASSALSAITDATGDKTLSNAAHNIAWNWQLTGAESAFTIGESGVSTGGSNNQYLFEVSTLENSTAIPFFVQNDGEGFSFLVHDDAGDTTPFVIDASGNVGIGDASPSALLSVGNGDLFTVNSSGAITAATGITSSGAITFSGLSDGFIKATSGVLSGGNSINLTTDITGTLPIANGGTGATTLNDLITLATHTTGNYVATLADAGNSFFTIANSGTENANVTIDIANDSIDLAQLADALTLDSATLTFDDGTNTLLTLTDAGTTGNLSITGDLTVSGDDIFLGTNTAGFILVADGTNYNPVAVSGDISINSSGVTVIGANAIALGTDTTGNYVATLADAGNNFFTIANGSTEGGAATIDLVADTIELTEVADTLLLDADLTFVAGAGEDITVNKTFTNATSENGYVLNFTGSDTTSGTTEQYGLYLDNIASTEGVDALVVLDNSDADDPVATAFKVIEAGGAGVFTNLFDINGTLISLAEFTVLDGGIDIASEVSGTLPIANGGTGATTLNNLITLSTHTQGNYVQSIADSGNSIFTVVNGVAEGGEVTLDIVANSIGNTQLEYDTGQALTTSSSPAFANLTLTTGGALRTNTSATNSLLLQAYDVDGAVYTTFGTLTAGNTPTFDLATSTTIGGNSFYYAGGTDIAVADGGTGASSLTANGILIGNGTSAITATTLSDGQLLIGDTDDAPVASTLTGTANQISVATGAGSITLSLPQDIASSSTPTFAGLTLANGETITNSTDGRISFTSNVANADTLNLTPATGGAGTFAGIITSADLTVDRTWTLPNVTGSIITSGDSGTVTNTMLAGSIAASKLIGTDIATVGTITSGVWNAGAVTSSGNIDATGTIQAGSSNITLTTASGYIDAGALDFIGAENGTTSSASGLVVSSDLFGLLQGCNDDEILKWNDGSGLWACSIDLTGGGGSTLQGAYDAGNTITTADSTNLTITLADTVTADGNFEIIIADGGNGTASITRANGTGTTDPAQLLLLQNADINRAVPIGLNILGSGGGFTTGIQISDSGGGEITTAIDVSDADIVTALSVGANTIAITTGTIGSNAATVIDFAEFDVSGATGSITIDDDGNAGSISIEGTVLDINSLDFTGAGTITTGGTFALSPGGAVTLGDGGDTLTINTSDWDISATGEITGVSFDANGTGNSISNIENADLANDTIDLDKIVDALTLDSATLTFDDGTNTLLTLTDAGTTGNLAISGDLTVSGDDIFLGTNTAGFILVADGTNYNPVAVSGDISINSSGVTAIGANAIALGTDSTGNYVATVADAGNSFFTVGGGGPGEGTPVTLDLVADSIDFTELADALTLDATTTIALGSFDLNINSNTLFIDGSGNNVGIGTDNPVGKLSVEDSGLAGGASPVYGITSLLGLSSGTQSTGAYGSASTFELTGSAIASGGVGASPAGTVGILSHASTGAMTMGSGSVGVFNANSAINFGTVSTAIGTGGLVLISADTTGGTITDAAALYANSTIDAGAGSITNNYGLLVKDQTAGTNDYGVAIEGADTQALWIGSGADNTDAANGIAFGSSLDTNLYRSAANTLKTDDGFVAASLTSAGTITFSGLTDGFVRATSGVLSGGNVPTLGTDTDGNYVATIADAGNGFFTVANSGTETAPVTLDLAADSIDLTELADTLSLDGDLAFTAGAGEDITVNKTFTNGTAENGFIINFTGADTGGATSAQYGLYLDNVGGAAGVDALMVLNNSSTSVVGAAVKVTDTGGGDYTNLFDIDGTLISVAEFNVLDGGIDLASSEVTGTLTVGKGGTGATTLTSGGILYGNGTSAIAATAVLTNGQLLIGDGTGAPTLGTISGTANQITVSNGAGTISLSLEQDIATTSTPTFAGITLANSETITNAVDGSIVFTDNGSSQTLTFDIDATNPQIATSAGALELNPFTGVVQGAGALTLQAGGANQDLSLKSSGTGTVNILPGTDSITAIQLQQADGTNILNVDSTNARIGIGNAAPDSVLHVTGSIGGTNTGSNAIAGIKSTLTINPTAGGFQFGNRSEITVSNTSTATQAVGDFIRVTDDTALANTVRGLEIQAYSGSNTLGTNTGLTAFGKTFGVQGITSGLAGGVSEPAGVYGELQYTTSGNAIRAYSANITSSDLVKFYHEDTNFTGTGLLMDFGNDTGSFTGDFLTLTNNTELKLNIGSKGQLSFLHTDADNAKSISIDTEETTGTNSIFELISDINGDETVAAKITVGGVLHISGLDAATSNNAAICWDGTGGINEKITDCNGAPSDLAENFGTTDSSIEAGDVVITTGEATTDEVDGLFTTKAWVKKSEVAYEKSIVGVISTQPNQLYADNVFTEEENPRPVTLAGRVPVKVNLENGPIVTGDLLTSSSEPGVAMKATEAGMVLGQALASYDGSSGSNKIIAFIAPFYYNPNSSVQEVLLDTETAGFLVNQSGSGNLLQLQNNGIDNFLVRNNGTVEINTSVADPETKLVVVKNGDSEVFSINARGDALFSGLLILPDDTFAGSIVTDTNGEATIEFSHHVGTGKPVVQLTPESTSPIFTQIASFTQDNDENYTGFILQARNQSGVVQSGVIIHYLVIGKQAGYETVGLNDVNPIVVQQNSEPIYNLQSSGGGAVAGAEDEVVEEVTEPVQEEVVEDVAEEGVQEDIVEEDSTTEETVTNETTFDNNETGVEDVGGESTGSDQESGESSAETTEPVIEPVVPEVETQPEPQAEPVSVPDSNPAPEPSPEPQPEVTPEPTSAPEPVAIDSPTDPDTN